MDQRRRLAIGPEYFLFLVLFEKFNRFESL